MHLNTAGEMLKRQWENLEHRFLNLHLDQYVIMPNHFHGIIILKNPFFVDQDQKRAHTRGAPTQNTNYSVNEIIRAFKSISAREYADEIKNAGTSFDTQFWQRNYYEHVIRTEESLGVLRKYILENPRRWREDVLFSKS